MSIFVSHNICSDERKAFSEIQSWREIIENTKQLIQSLKEKRPRTFISIPAGPPLLRDGFDNLELSDEIYFNHVHRINTFYNIKLHRTISYYIIHVSFILKIKAKAEKV